MNKKIIYCYSGTGNGIAAAKAISKSLENAKIISMCNDPAMVSSADADVIGFIFPVYYWNIPDHVRNFVKSVEINANAYIFAIASCGGISGNSLNDIQQLLSEKGAKLSYSCVHLNVANYIVAYNRFPNPKKQVPKAEGTLVSITTEIRNHICNQPPKSNPIKLLQRLIIPAFTRDFSQIDKGYHVSDQCVSCGICSKVCPANNIRFVNGNPVFQHRCEHCMACIQYCPQKAINYKNRTQKRERYHHPSISASEMATFNSQNISTIDN